MKEAEALRINKELAIETALKPADCILVFGSPDEKPAYIALDLYKKGLAPLIALTGSSLRTNIPEADKHEQILLENGVPADAIVKENTSTTTIENITNIIPVLEERIGIQHIGSIICVAKWFHVRRAIMTAKKYLPNGIRYYGAPYEPDEITMQNWWKDPESVERILFELMKVPKYTLKGDIVEIEEKDGYYI